MNSRKLQKRPSLRCQRKPKSKKKTLQIIEIV
jgi:hypothetical protein